MNAITLAIFLIMVVSIHAGEYRFRCLGEVTGLCDLVYDQDGKATTIKLDFADRESAAIFLALQKKRIYGTTGFEDHWGVKYEQGISLIGEFTSEVKMTPDAPNMAASEPYRDFRVTGIKLQFPVWRFQEVPTDDPSASPVFMETHFSFESLFPQGLEADGKPIDLRKHSIDPRLK